jgi:hypothetical protein
MANSDSVVWTGNNLAAVKAFHNKVAHYPRNKGDDSYRAPDQHPDNLHLEREDGTTLIAAPGDTITRDRKGMLAVEEADTRRPTATGRLGGGTVYDVEAHASPRRSKPARRRKPARRKRGGT